MYMYIYVYIYISFLSHQAAIARCGTLSHTLGAGACCGSLHFSKKIEGRAWCSFMAYQLCIILPSSQALFTSTTRLVRSLVSLSPRPVVEFRKEERRGSCWADFQNKREQRRRRLFASQEQMMTTCSPTRVVKTNKCESPPQVWATQPALGTEPIRVPFARLGDRQVTQWQRMTWHIAAVRDTLDGQIP